MDAKTHRFTSILKVKIYNIYISKMSIRTAKPPGFSPFSGRLPFYSLNVSKV